VPDVRDEYYNAFRDLYIPGKLALQNLADNRRMVLDTGQEGSEVLVVRPNGDFLYRVNDSIYSVRIAGNQIEKGSLIVKDTDVPEIHWAFYGPTAKNVAAADR
jgi:hypothetical protein